MAFLGRWCSVLYEFICPKCKEYKMSGTALSKVYCKKCKIWFDKDGNIVNPKYSLVRNT